MSDPTHHPATTDRFPITNGELTIGGLGLTRLTERVGSTPYFAYDRDLLTERVEMLRGLLDATIHLNYAIKANPMPAVVQHLARLVDGLDVASGGELTIALDTPLRPDHISFAGPGKSDPELRRAVATGILIEAESESEIERIGLIGATVGVTPRIAIRINPDFQVRGSGMRMGGGSAPFGIDAERVPAAVAQALASGIDMVGFHIFGGSQNLKSEMLIEAQDRTADLVLALASQISVPVRYVNLGGGFGIPYTARDEPLDVEAVTQNLNRLARTVLLPALPQARIVIELGRYLVGESGLYVTRVVDRKVSRGRTYLVVDGGMHHQLAASGNFGQAIRRNYPLAIGNRLGASSSETVTVVGCLCTPLDLLGSEVELPVAQVGDLVVLFQAGAYGLTASPTRFLGHPEPAEVLL